MKNIILLLLFGCFSLSCVANEIEEPDFIGDVLLVSNEEVIPLDKEIEQFTSGVSWSANSWNATYMKIDGAKASVRIPKGTSTVKLIIKAADNNSDPMSIISIFKFKEKRKNRETMLKVDNSDNAFRNSYTVTKNLQKFSGRKYGESSYEIQLNNLEPGEYGIVVKNPNAVDEKRVIVACFGINK